MVPEFEARAAAGERIRIWSAGCSSGEEPYSIAMTLKENWPTIGRADLKILATDIDPGMVAAARRGSTPHNRWGMIHRPHSATEHFMGNSGRRTDTPSTRA
jgi:chemotaxis protein methyltransferase CheR